MEMGERRRIADLGYGCFLFCGLVCLVGSISNYVPMNSATTAGFGLLVIVPLTMISVIAVLVAVGCSVRLRTHVPLGALSAASLVFIIIMVAEAIHGPLYDALPMVYGTFAVASSLGWFLVVRRRLSERPT
jgi:hypothetical protein